MGQLDRRRIATEPREGMLVRLTRSVTVPDTIEGASP
jgi:hypothetical protein